MMQTGDVRFRVSYAPAEMFDSVDDANDGMLFVDFPSFDVAAVFACDKAGGDFFGVTSITLETCTNAKYGWWEESATWHVEAPCRPFDLDMAKPDYTG